MDQNSIATIADSYNPDSPVGTEFLRLFHNLVRGTDPKASKAYLITSATLGEGKSTVAAFLALTMANLKRKTLLVDADLRRPAIHRLFDLSLEDGVTDVVESALPLARAYKETALVHLSVLTAGRLARNPTDYFENGHVQKILDDAKARFDFVVVDCAPVMPVVDALLIAESLSGVLLVVKAGETHRELVKEAAEILKKAKAPLAGVVMNNVKEVLPYHYSYRYSYQYYAPAPGG